jgi:two-component system response regulator AlgR
MRKTILLADDSPLIGQTLYRALATEGIYDLCAQAADGSEAISLAKRYKPNLVILDLAMPEMNGLETPHELKKIMPTVPVILFTLHGSTARELFAGDSCVDLVIPKGDFTNLMNHVRTLLSPTLAKTIHSSANLSTGSKD